MGSNNVDQITRTDKKQGGIDLESEISQERAHTLYFKLLQLEDGIKKSNPECVVHIIGLLPWPYDHFWSAFIIEALNHILWNGQKEDFIFHNISRHFKKELTIPLKWKIPKKFVWQCMCPALNCTGSSITASMDRWIRILSIWVIWASKSWGKCFWACACKTVSRNFQSNWSSDLQFFIRSFDRIVPPPWTWTSEYHYQWGIAIGIVARFTVACTAAAVSNVFLVPGIGTCVSESDV